MDTKIEQALQFTLKNWGYMLGQEDIELSDEFMTSFYAFIDAIREYVNRIDPRPATLEQLLQLPMVVNILDRLPEELHLNFRNEAELIIANKTRILE